MDVFCCEQKENVWNEVTSGYPCTVSKAMTNEQLQGTKGNQQPMTFGWEWYCAPLSCWCDCLAVCSFELESHTGEVHAWSSLQGAVA